MNTPGSYSKEEIQKFLENVMAHVREGRLTDPVAIVQGIALGLGVSLDEAAISRKRTMILFDDALMRAVTQRCPVIIASQKKKE